MECATPRYIVLLAIEPHGLHYTMSRHTTRRCDILVRGRLHSLNDRPSTRDYLFNSIEWHEYGVPHRRGDKPAVIDRHGAKWYQRGAHQRCGGGPTNMNFTLVWLVWSDDQGHTHRDGDKPASIVDWQLMWYIGGSLWRLTGPAVISVNEQSCTISWYERNFMKGRVYANGSNTCRWGVTHPCGV